VCGGGIYAAPRALLPDLAAASWIKLFQNAREWAESHAAAAADSQEEF
jgi:hypothetical protein